MLDLKIIDHKRDACGSGGIADFKLNNGVRLDIIVPEGYDISVLKDIEKFAAKNKVPINIIELGNDGTTKVIN